MKVSRREQRCIDPFDPLGLKVRRKQRGIDPQRLKKETVVAMINKNEYKFLLIEKSAVPEKLLRTVEVKKLLSKNKNMTIDEAVKAAGIGRSTFYKYRDSIFPFYETTKGKVITLFFVVEDFSGILLNIIEKISMTEANIVTINQNIPINGLADITISIETAGMKRDIGYLLDEVRAIEGLRKCEILERD